ncbi:MAG: OmpA family protein [Pseudomonadota bacterium]
MKATELNLFTAVPIILMGIAGCDTAETPFARSSNVTCVPIPDGQYVFQNGVFSQISAGQTLRPDAADTADSGEGWATVLQAQFPAMGYGWMGLRLRGRTATLTGTAPDESTKEAGLTAGQALLLADPNGARAVDVVIDGIDVEGGAAGVGGALAALGERPTLDACQDAFLKTMEGRTVAFRINSATILPESARLLDAAAGAGILCQAYNIEIAGHTDSIGDDADNMVLSQNRADAVRLYLLERGVPSGGLTSVGYGETQPLDTSGTQAGLARNRRTEFILSPREL